MGKMSYINRSNIYKLFLNIYMYNVKGIDNGLGVIILNVKCIGNLLIGFFYELYNIKKQNNRVKIILLILLINIKNIGNKVNKLGNNLCKYIL